MSVSRIPNPEGLHLLILKGAVYAGVVLLFVCPMATWSGAASALAMIPVALLASHFLAKTRLRGPLLCGVGLGVALLGLLTYSLVGSQSWLARWLGYETMMAWLEGLTLGLVTLGTLFTLRTMTLQLPVMALAEASLVTSMAVWAFVGHRDAQLDQPRSLSDWAFSRGHDPLLLVLGVGLLTMGGLALLLLHERRLVKTVGSVAILLCLCAGAGLWLKEGPADPPKIEDDKAGGSSSQDFGPKSKPKPGTPVAIVLLKDDYEPVEELFYFRQQVFSRFNGQRLVASELPSPDQENGSPQLNTPERSPVLFSIAPRRPDRKTIKTQVVEITEMSHPLALANSTKVESLVNPDPQRFRKAYEVMSQVLDKSYSTMVGDLVGNPAWSPELRRHYLEFPGDPRYRKLADEIVNTLSPFDRTLPFLKVLATRRWLEKNVIYSLSPAPHGDQDPTSAFLFGDRRGYCVHIAHAMAFLLRAQGIPTRVAGGYAVEPRSRQGSNVVVLDNQAHAWCEVYVQGVGWIVMDAAPERTEEEPTPPPSPMLITQLGELARRQAPVKTAEAENAAWGQYAWMIALAGGLGVVLALYLVKIWRRLAPRLLGARRQYRLAYRAVLDRLAELGQVRRFGETREEFAQRLVPLVPAFVDLTAAHMRQAVGGLATGSSEEYRHLSNRIHADLASKFSTVRRILGLLNPVSWWWAR